MMSCYNRNHSGSPDWHFFALGILILIVLLFIRSCSSSVAYNNGVCAFCGGHYVFQQAICHRNWTNYMYTCNKCGRMIETSEYYPVYNEGENNER